MEGGSIKGEKKEERVKVGKEQMRKKAERDGENGDWKVNFTDKEKRKEKGRIECFKGKLTQA